MQTALYKTFRWLLLLSLCTVRAQQVVTSTPEASTVVLFTPGGYFYGWGDEFKKPFGKADFRSEGAVFDGTQLIAVMTPSR